MKKFFLLLSLLLFAKEINAANLVNGFEYWFDSDYSKKLSKTVSAASSDVLVTESLDVSTLTNGFHKLSIRYSDNNNKWSTVTDYYFFKANPSAQDNVGIEFFEYWFDDNIDTKVKVNVNSTNNLTSIANQIDLKSINRGFHKISFNFTDNNSIKTIVTDNYFFYAGESSDNDVLITSFRYWWDSDQNNLKEVTLPNASTIIDINQYIDLKAAGFNEFPQYFNIQFKDNTGTWSSIYTKSFFPIPDFDIFNVVNTFSFKNTSSFAYSYQWDFGDGTPKDTSINPTHTYSKPGVYNVTLTAKNKLGVKDTFKIVQIYGLREVISSKAGNTGEASIFIYGGGFKKNMKVWLEGDSVIKADTAWIHNLDAIQARFNLLDKKIGVYDVVVQFGTDPPLKLAKSFTIEKGTKAEPYISFNGRDRILFGRKQTYTLDFGNTGNVDALGVPVYFLITLSDGMEVEFLNLNNQMSYFWKDSSNYSTVNQYEGYFENDGYFDGNERVRVYPFYIPVIPANSSNQVKLNIKTNKSFKTYVWMNEQIFQVEPGSVIKIGKEDDNIQAQKMDKKTADCLRAVMLQASKDGIASIVNNMIPGVSCANSILNRAFSPAKYLAPKPDNPEWTRKSTWAESIFGWGWTIKDYTMTFVTCATTFFPPAQAYKAALGVVSLANNIISGYKSGFECYRKYGNKSKNVSAVSSFDPNEMVGPAGFTSKNYTKADGKFTYSIYFENKSTATAPAQEVIIIDTLDKTKFDIASFSFGQFGFSRKNYSPYNGLKQFTLDIDSLKFANTFLRVNAKLDTLKGIVQWQFITLEKSTMDYPQDPDAGFLPPNKNQSEGEGFVSFDIKLLDSIKTNDVIKNQAKIIFDLNQPIFTNTYVNTIDNESPTSKITAIYSTNKPNKYRMTINSSDNHSGVRNWVIYASKNDSAYIPVFATKDKEFYFECDPGITYKFFSIALDSAGNTESIKSKDEVNTVIVNVDDNIVNTTINNLLLYPNPASNKINIDFNSASLCEYEIKIFNILGLEVYNSKNYTTNLGRNIFDLDISNFDNGIYVIQIKDNISILSQQFTIIK